MSYSTFQDVVEEQKHLQEAGLTSLVAFPVGTMLRDYRIIIQGTKIAFDSRGVVIYRAGFGEDNKEHFRRVFQKLAASR